MINQDKFRKMALSYPDVVMQPHFNKESFRVRDRIFATLDAHENSVTFKLTVEQQSLFGLHDPASVFPVHGKWGLKGWTCVLLDTARPDVLRDLVDLAYKGCAR